MSIKIGVVESNIPVNISAASPNEHIAIFGLSGTGKSTRISEIVHDINTSGKTVIMFDVSGYDFPASGKENRIFVGRDGLNLSFLEPFDGEVGKEIYANHLAYLVDMFVSVYKLGTRQRGFLRLALEYALKNRQTFSNDAEAIIAGLEGQDSDIAEGVYNKLWQLLHSNIWEKSHKHFLDGKINVIDFSGVNPSMQKEVTEILIYDLWAAIRMARGSFGVCLVLDECQHFLTKGKTILLEMLRESRKYGTNIILSTQTTAGFSVSAMAAINQSAVQLYFRPAPSDIKKVADTIAPQDAGRWRLKLKNLQIGESIAIGNLVIGRREIMYPIVIRSAYNEKNGMDRDKNSLQITSKGLN